MITPVTCGQCGKDLGLAYTPRDITRLQNNHTCKEKK